jgi:hypothetical protein
MVFVLALLLSFRSFSLAIVGATITIEYSIGIKERATSERSDS